MRYADLEYNYYVYTGMHTVAERRAGNMTRQQMQRAATDIDDTLSDISKGKNIAMYLLPQNEGQY